MSLEGADSMENMGRSLLLRLLALSAVVVLVLGAAACGSDDSGDSDGDSNATAASSEDESGSAEEIDTSTPEGQVRAALAQWTEGLQKPDPKSACAVVTPKVEKQLKVIYTKGKTCEDVVRFVAPRINQGDPEVLSVKVSGDKATMKVASAKGDRQQDMEFTKQNGTWKISDGFGAPPEKVKQAKG